VTIVKRWVIYWDKKTFINEFVAYEALQQYMAGCQLSERSVVIATYALCGFANFGSMGIQLGGLTPLAPHRKQEFATLVFSAMIAGTVACFMTACIAGVLYESDGNVLPEQCYPIISNSTDIISNSTGILTTSLADILTTSLQ